VNSRCQTSETIRTADCEALKPVDRPSIQASTTRRTPVDDPSATRRPPVERRVRRVDQRKVRRIPETLKLVATDGGGLPTAFAFKSDRKTRFSSGETNETHFTGRETNEMYSTSA
jgi:hypothetical protein